MKPRIEERFSRAPLFLKPFLWPVKFLFYRCRDLWETMSVEMWLLEGKERSGGQDLSIAYAGVDIHKDHLARLAFSEPFADRSLGRTWIWRAFSRLKKTSPDCPLYVIEANKRQSPLFRLKSRFRVPVWVFSGLELTDAPNHGISSHYLKETRKTLRKHGYTGVVANDEASFDDFYHNMYVPFTRKRHGRSAFVHDYALLKALSFKCDLLFVEKDGERIAGGFNNYSGVVPQLMYLGIRDGKEAFIKLGIVRAMDYFSVMRILEKGFRRLDMGDSRAFLHDGPLMYKTHFGASITHHDENIGILHWRFGRCTEGLKAFLAANPFIHYAGPRRYRGTVFVRGTEKTVKDLPTQQWVERFRERGLQGVDIYTLDAAGEPRL